MAADKSKIDALMEWVNEELAIVAAAAPLILSSEDLHALLTDLGVSDVQNAEEDLIDLVSRHVQTQPIYQVHELTDLDGPTAVFIQSIEQDFEVFVIVASHRSKHGIACHL